MLPETIRNPNYESMWHEPWQASQGRPPLHEVNVMLDIDDVFFPWLDEVHERCRAAGLHDGKQKITQWSMWEDYGCSKEAWLDVVAQAALDGMYTAADPIPGSVEAARRLYWEGATLHVVTARGFMSNASNIRDWTDVWLERVGFPWHTRTFNRDKVGAQAAIFHHDRMRSIGAPEAALPTYDYAIDAGVHNYEALDAAGIEVYLLDADHNQDFPAERRVSSVGEFVDLIINKEANRG